jgi:lipopolysaccharide biosynthesis glycosyltransferase
MKKVKIAKKNKYNDYFDDEDSLAIIINLKNCKICLAIVSVILIILLLFFLFRFFKGNKFKNYINVSYAFDGNYHYIAHVSMKSIMLSQEKTTFINFYMLVSNINDEQKEVINKICLEHEKCKIIYIDMGDQFKELYIPKDNMAVWSTANFYRVKLQDLLPNEHKILYLDTDTLIYKDLTKLYNYNITGKYYVGMPEYKDIYYFLQYKEKFKNFINTGVVLCNLDELRKLNFTNKFAEFFNKYNKKIKFPVNDATNIITHEKNGYFEPEYVVIGFCNEKEIQKYYKRMSLKIDVTEVINAYNDPYVYHLITKVKPWRDIPTIDGLVCFEPMIRFYEMAKKTVYFHKILELFPVNITKI